MLDSLIYWFFLRPSGWVYFVLAGLLLAGALACIIRLIIGDRKRPARCCPKCRYDMTQTPGRKCPECGRTARSERAMKRSRVRYFRWTAAALVLLLTGTPLMFVPHVRAHAAARGWPSIIPTRLAPWLLPVDTTYIDSNNLGWMCNEMEFRFGSGGTPGPFGAYLVDVNDLASVLSRMARGIPFVRPPSKLWTERYFSTIQSLSGRYVERTADGSWRTCGFFNDPLHPAAHSAALDAAMEEVNNVPFIAQEITTRAIWPYGTEVFLVAPVFNCWHRPYELRQELSVSVNGGPWTVSPQVRWGGPIGLTGDASTPNPTTLEVRVEVLRVIPNSPSEQKSMGEYRQTLIIGFAPTLHDVMTPVSDPALDTLLAEGWFSNQFARFTDAGIRPHPAVDGTVFEDVAISARVESLCNGVVIDRHFIRDGLGVGEYEPGFVFDYGYGPHTLMGLRERIYAAYYEADAIRPDGPCERWTTRLTSVPGAIRAIKADRYWVGSVEFGKPKPK